MKKSSNVLKCFSTQHNKKPSEDKNMEWKGVLNAIGYIS